MRSERAFGERKYMGLQSIVLVKTVTCVAVAAPVYVTHIKNTNSS